VRVTAPADSPEEARTSWPAMGFRRWLPLYGCQRQQLLDCWRLRRT